MQGPQPSWYSQTPDEVLAALQTSHQGLSTTEAAERLRLHGANTIETGRQISLWAILLRQFTSPLIYILLVAALVTLIIQHWADAIVISAVLVLNAVIGFVQEYRAENAMQALLRLVSPTAVVVRDGREHELPSKDLVPGDFILLESGALIPADIRLLRSTMFIVDEAVLTGESGPVSKSLEPLSPDSPLAVADQENMAFLGTTVTSGRGAGIVVATGRATQVGAIAQEMRHTVRAETPLQSRMAHFGRWISLLILGTSTIAFAAGLALGEPLTEMFLVAVALAVSAIPEGLPVVMTIALAVSVRRMARRHAIIRRLAAVETLGSCTIIMSDKTGTLTKNQMTVQGIVAGGFSYTVAGSDQDVDGGLYRDGTRADVAQDEPLRLTLETGLLANEASLYEEDGDFVGRGDPTEVALLVAGAKAGISRQTLLTDYPLVSEIPFESERQFSATIHRREDEEYVFVKGAPERVVAMCDTWMTTEGLLPIDVAMIANEAQQMAEQGFRVLAMATGKGEQVGMQAKTGSPSGLTFLGLQGMLDPPREEVAQALRACNQAGIRVIMVTGDHATTAATVAEKIGLRDPEKVFTGAELEAMSDSELERALPSVSVYARVSPSQKLRLVMLLRGLGHVVAVTGDGANDAPALKAAHIGASMGIVGTDVAKEASDMVLTDDNFATIYAAVEEGRTAFSNIRKAAFFLISSGAGELVAILAGLALRMPLPFLPAQILWLNLVTNGIADVALALEPGEQREYRNPPRDPKAGVISRLLVERTAVVGVLLAVGTLGVLAIELRDGASLGYAQVSALTTMVMFQTFHAGNCRSEEVSVFRINPFSNPLLLFGVFGSFLVHLGALYFPPTQFLLNLEPLTLESWMRIIPISVSVVGVVEVHKLVRRPKVKASGAEFSSV